MHFHGWTEVVLLLCDAGFAHGLAILEVYGMKSDEQLHEIVQRIVEAVHPLRVILFGSTARGEAGPQSDLDILIVVPDGTHRFNTTQAVYQCLRGLRVAVDVVVATESDVREYGNSPVLIYREALRDGRELYAA